MRELELLAPARNADIGIAAIDCGADAVYMAGPKFGARKDAGNPLEEIGRLCAYARRYGVRVYMTVNVLLRDGEMEEVHDTMLEAQKLGVSAFIIRDTRICGWHDITVPLHASTQCVIRTPERALELTKAGCSRVIAERELSLGGIRALCMALEPHGCEVECFVHGALCVSYSGQCTMSEALTGRSADRGECIQACRALYDLEDESGTVLVRSKALLSLKDLNLLGRVEELADAGACSFKIEGRLKNESYVRNVVYAYSRALDVVVSSRPGEYRRSSFGHTTGGFTPDLDKTFNRGYCDILSLMDSPSGGWACMDAPKNMGEFIGKVIGVRPASVSGCVEVTLDSFAELANGDGFAFVCGSSIVGFRGDVCSAGHIVCKKVDGLRPGVEIFRNVSQSFERALKAAAPARLLAVDVSLEAKQGELVATARCEDGASACASLPFSEYARDARRAAESIAAQIGKTSGIYRFRVTSMPQGGNLPFLRVSELNGLRRGLAVSLEAAAASRCLRHPGLDPASQPALSRPLPSGLPAPVVTAAPGELIRTKYCIRRELGFCLKRGTAAPSAAPALSRPLPPCRLFLVNNGRRFPLVFDCARCEMVVGNSRNG